MASLHSGGQLDHYRIDNLVARGGMASIFRATDVRTGMVVAIKFLHPEMECDPALYDRFKREHEIGQKLNHPGVMKVLADNGLTELYMVLEWVEGRLLRQILNEHRKLPSERAARITLRVAEALEYIHDQGVAQSRSEAREHHGRCRGPYQTHRLRYRFQCRGSQTDFPESLANHGDAGLYLSGTSQRKTRRPTQ
jgi:serine/threonine protein kinase